MAIHVPGGSVAQDTQAILPDAVVVVAFQSISAHDLLGPDKSEGPDMVEAKNASFSIGRASELGKIALDST